MSCDCRDDEPDYQFAIDLGSPDDDQSGVWWSAPDPRSREVATLYNRYTEQLAALEAAQASGAERQQHLAESRLMDVVDALTARQVSLTDLAPAPLTGHTIHNTLTRGLTLPPLKLTPRGRRLHEDSCWTRLSAPGVGDVRLGYSVNGRRWYLVVDGQLRRLTHGDALQALMSLSLDYDTRQDPHQYLNDDRASADQWLADAVERAALQYQSVWLALSSSGVSPAPPSPRSRTTSSAPSRTMSPAPPRPTGRPRRRIQRRSPSDRPPGGP